MKALSLVLPDSHPKHKQPSPLEERKAGHLATKALERAQSNIQKEERLPQSPPIIGWDQ
jgi:hypothetical protein